MNNGPYQPPKTDVALPARAGTDIPWLTTVLGVIAILPGFALLMLAVVAGGDLPYMFVDEPIYVGVGFATGLSSLIGGGLLLRLSRLAVPALGLTAVAAFVNITVYQGPTSAVLWPLGEFGAFIYSAWLWWRGALGSRVN